MADPSAASEFRDRLAFDSTAGAILDQTRRYLLIRPDSLMGIFARLPAPARQEALAAMEDAVFEHGSDSARAYRASGAGDARALVALIERTAPQLGWGRWSFTFETGRLGLTVLNSPFAQGYGAASEPVCHAIKGMLRAVAAMVFEAPVDACEPACAACGANDCRFEARPVTGTGPAP